MFVVLAMVALCTPLLSLLCSTLYFLSERKPASTAILFGFAYAMMFYNYIPGSGNDSMRHMAWLAYYQGIPIAECFDTGHYTQLYVWDLWNWIIAQFHLPFLLPASGAFLGYTIVTYLIFDYCKRVKASNQTVISTLVLVLAATNPIGYAVGIRSSCAYAVCVLGIYLCEVRGIGKIPTALLMVAAVLIHHSAALVFLIWLVIPFYKKKPLPMLVAIGCSILMLSTIIRLVTPLLPASGGFSRLVLEMFGTISAYQQESEYNIANSTSLKARVEMMCSILYLLAVIVRSRDTFPAYVTVRSKGKDSPDVKAYWMKSITILYIVVGLAMMLVLVINGKRYLAVPEVMLSVVLTFSFQQRPLGKIRRVDLTQLVSEGLMVGMSLLHLMLNIYSLAWGDASLGSLAGGALGGIIYALVA